MKTEQNGFTIVEAIVTIAVVSIFVGYMFQFYLVTESQRISVARRSSASDIAYSNLDKVTAKGQIPSSSPYACNTATDSTANNLTVKVDATGSDLIGTGVVTPENTTSVNLGPGVSQKLTVTYPRGCDPSMPARIQSTVTYGSNPVESVVHVSFIN